ncbi:MAG: nicotinate-nucleotide adenylyltransferase [Candidatus Omnitrophica bacterium]|nr:nicotinate-nucleotide adenylyltransferase [Candidatus Omnitrophota bacterium]
MRIGVLGGTFNPIHIGHLILAEEAFSKLSLDKVIFVPAFIPPHKIEEELVSADHRYRMIEIAIKDNPNFEISNIELRRSGRSYSVDTLRQFKKLYGKFTKLFFITGSDSLGELFSWKDINDIFKLSQFVVANRPGYPFKELPKEAELVLITPIEVSSSQIRKRIREGLSIRYLVPDAVRNYINKKGLYR